MAAAARAHKRGTLEHRVERRIHLLDSDGIKAYARHLRDHEEEAEVSTDRQAGGTSIRVAACQGSRIEVGTEHLRGGGRPIDLGNELVASGACSSKRRWSGATAARVSQQPRTRSGSGRLLIHSFLHLL